MDTSRLGSPSTEPLDVPLMQDRRPLRTWAGHGTGAACNGCGTAIQPDEIEYEVELSAADGRSLRFHFNCYRDWTGR
jgi:hypothetical protein